MVTQQHTSSFNTYFRYNIRAMHHLQLILHVANTPMYIYIYIYIYIYLYIYIYIFHNLMSLRNTLFRYSSVTEKTPL